MWVAEPELGNEDTDSGEGMAVERRIGCIQGNLSNKSLY